MSDMEPEPEPRPTQEYLTRPSARAFATELLYHEEDFLELRQPPSVPICERVTHGARPAMVNVATDLLTRLTNDWRDSGAWVAFMRIFVKGTLQNIGQGGKRGARRQNNKMREFLQHKWAKVYRRQPRQRTKRKKKSNTRQHANLDTEKEECKKKIQARAQRLLMQGRISQGLQALEASPTAPNDENTYQAMVDIHPKSLNRYYGSA